MTCDSATTLADPREIATPVPAVDERARLLEIIALAPCFRALAEPHLDALAGAATIERFAAERLIARDGEAADRFFLILKGEVDAFWGDALREVLRSLGRGDVFGAGLILGEPHPHSFAAQRETDVAVWNGDALHRAERASPGLRSELAVRLAKERRARELDDLLRHAPLFRNSTSALRHRLLNEATLLCFGAGAFLYREGEPATCCHLVVHGEVELRQGERVSIVERGAVFGEIDLLEGALHAKPSPRTESAQAKYDTEVLAIDRIELEALRRACGSVRRSLAAQAARHGMAAPPLREWILVAGHVPYTMRSVVSLLPDAFAEAGVGEAAVLEVAPEGDASIAASDDVLALPSDPTRAIEALDERTARLRGRYCVIYTRAAHALEWLATPLWDAIIEQRIASSVYFTDDLTRSFPFERPPLAPAHYVELRPELGPRDARRGQRPSMARRGAVRLRIDAMPGVDLGYGRLSTENRLGLQRLARTLAHRTVGVALGGGSAWCYAHVALLRALHEAAIPVDVVSGTSLGSLIACAYGSRGLEGLDVLIAQRWESAFRFALFPITRWPLERWFEKNLLQHRDLQDMPVPVLPVAVDIQTGRSRIFHHGPVLEALLASSAFPGVCPPIILGDGVRCVDGGVATNVPVSALVREGADFIIASNVVPSPETLGRETHTCRVSRFLSQHSPIGRLRDGFRAMLFVAREVGTRDASIAHATFAPSLEKFGFHDFLFADAIVTHVQPELSPFIDHVKERYRAFCRSCDA